MSLRARVLIGAAVPLGILGGLGGVAYATGSMPERLTPVAFMNEAFISKNCPEGDRTWYCPIEREDPDELPPGGMGTLVAFGDSYSAGEGAPVPAFSIGCVVPGKKYPSLPSPDICANDDDARPTRWVPVSGFRAGTDNGINECHRSKYAYPFKVAQELGLSLDHRACSGAVSSDYSHTRIDVPERTPGTGSREWNKNPDGTPLSPQASEPMPADTRLVTVGFGGNNAGFSDIIKVCLGQPTGILTSVPVVGWWVPLLNNRYGDGCADFVREQNAQLASALGTEAPGSIQSIERVFKDIRRSAPADARVIAIGYPRVFPKTPTRGCGMGAGEAFMTVEDQQAINDFVQDLNDALDRAATAANIDFVDMEDRYEVPDSGQDHGLCNDNDDDRWITRIRLQDDNTVVAAANGAMHPTELGHMEAAKAVLECYNDERLCANYAERRIEQLSPEWKRLSYAAAKCVSRNESWDSASWDAENVDVSSRDVTGDGRAEAVIQLTCPSSNSSWPTVLQVWSVAETSPTLLLAVDDLYFRGTATWSVDDGPGISMRGVTVGASDPSCCARHWGEVRYFWTGTSFLLDHTTETVDLSRPYEGEPSLLSISDVPLPDGHYTARLAGAGYSAGLYYVVVDPVILASELVGAPPGSGYLCFPSEDPVMSGVVSDSGVCPGPVELTRMDVANGGLLTLLNGEFVEDGWGSAAASLEELSMLDEQGRLGGLVDVVVNNGQVDSIEEVAFLS